MKKIRDGIDGEVNAEIFETWFPYMGYDDPILFLEDFIRSESSEMIIIKKINETDFMISRIPLKYADGLLQELREMR